jgi:predicted RNase H-like nuclease (RuvC/YqgF family)
MKQSYRFVINLLPLEESKPSRSSRGTSELERLQRENRTLQSSIEQLTQSEERLAAKVSDYQKEVEE